MLLTSKYLDICYDTIETRNLEESSESISEITRNALAFLKTDLSTVVVK